MPKALKVFFMILGILFLSVIIAYLSISFYMKGRFFQNTSINGVDVSFMTKEEARDALLSKAEGYNLVLIDNFGRTENFTKEELGLGEYDMDRLDMIREGQNPLLWGESFYTTYVYEDSNLFSVDPQKVLGALRSRDIIKYAGGTRSKDAYIVFDEDADEFVIIPEVYGNIIDPLVLEPIIDERACKLYEVLDTKVEGGYDTPSVTADDEELTNELKLYNEYKDASIRYEMKGAEEIVGPQDYVEWLVTDGDKVSVDRNKVKAFVKGMAEKYDTFGKERKFVTSWGDVVHLESEEMGWEIDQEKEVAQLCSEVLSNRDIVRDFNYLHEAESHGNTDIGDTYIEVNFTKQHLYLYKEGKAVLDTDIVTGNTSRGMATPSGIFHIYNKAKNRYLVGENYRSWVYYWMPFYKAYGLHDATWRKEFGGQIYKGGGSHGCVNLPLEKAGELYENIEVGYPVILYFEE